MPAPLINPNAFQQQQVAGDLDLNVAMTGVISGLLSQNQATPLVCGTPLKFDSSITTGRLPQFVAAAQSDLAVGYLKRTMRQSTYAPGDVIEVTMEMLPVMWLTAQGTIAPGAQVESGTDPTTVQTRTSNSCRGFAIDPATSGQLVRVALTTAIAKQA